MAKEANYVGQGKIILSTLGRFLRISFVALVTKAAEKTPRYVVGISAELL